MFKLKPKNQETYFFYGTVLPERAQLSLGFELSFSHLTTGLPGKVKVSILLNQVAVWVETNREWDILTLRNVVKTILQNHLAMVGYLTGYAYDLEITRVLSPDRKIDYVFGIEIPCIEERGKHIDLPKALAELSLKAAGENGVFINRCLNDLSASMKHADDTGFYCYRTIESLRHHCAALHNLSMADKKRQWEKFNEVSGYDRDAISPIKQAADPLRHGEALKMTSEQRADLFKLTWDIVDAYFKKI